MKRARWAWMCAVLWVGLGAAAFAQSEVTRYVRYEAGGGAAYGILEGETIHALLGDLFGSPTRTGVAHKLADVRLLAPCEPSSPRTSDPRASDPRASDPQTSQRPKEKRDQSRVSRCNSNPTARAVNITLGAHRATTGEMNPSIAICRPNVSVK